MLGSTLRTWCLTSRQVLFRWPAPQSTISSRGKKSRAKSNKSIKASAQSAPNNLDLDLDKYEQSMESTINALQNNYSRIRLEGASPTILDDVGVLICGKRTPLNNLAQVSIRDGRTLMVNVFDEQTSSAVEKAIRGAGLNLNPIAETAGKLRIPVPKPSKETRDRMRETISKDAEAAKVTTRMVRRKALEDVKSLKEYVSKDQVKRMEKSVQALTDGFVEKIVKLQVSKVRALDAGRSS